MDHTSPDSVHALIEARHASALEKAGKLVDSGELLAQCVPSFVGGGRIFGEPVTFGRLERRARIQLVEQRKQIAYLIERELQRVEGLDDAGNVPRRSTCTDGIRRRCA